MAKYSIESTKQIPFKTGMKTKLFDLEAVTDNHTNKISSFALTIKGKKDLVKTFPIKGTILKTFKSLESFIEANF